MVGVAISGRAGSGKSTLARALFHHGFTTVAFGDALKADVLTRYGLDKFDLGGREKLVEHGDRMRLADADHWIRPVAERTRLAQVCGLPVVVDDVRFFREAMWARRAGFLLVRIDAPLSARRMRLALQGLDADFATATGPGEAELEQRAPRWDAHVWNAQPGECVAAAIRLAALVSADRPQAPAAAVRVA